MWSEPWLCLNVIHEYTAFSDEIETDSEKQELVLEVKKQQQFLEVSGLSTLLIARQGNVSTATAACGQMRRKLLKGREVNTVPLTSGSKRETQFLNTGQALTTIAQEVALSLKHVFATLSPSSLNPLGAGIHTACGMSWDRFDGTIPKCT